MKTIKTILENETGKKVVWNDNFKVYGVNLESKSEAEKISKKVQKEGFSTSIIEKVSRFFLNVTPDEKVLKSIFKDLLNKDIFSGVNTVKLTASRAPIVGKQVVVAVITDTGLRNGF